LHKASKKVIEFCIENDIGTIVVGHNKNWKQNSNMGKKNNQSFISIPFNKLIHMLEYKGKMVGVEVKIKEESYTSKIDHLVKEEMKKQEIYLGKRKKRGLFESSIGKLLNVDVNGSIGILRKDVASNDWLNNLGSRGCVYQPVKINIL